MSSGRFNNTEAACTSRVRDVPSMKSSTKDRAKGKVNKLAGKAKEKVGRATGNTRMEDRGTGQKIRGKVREKVGDVKKVFDA